ncbi:4Fe-4S binding protein [Candidatus Micrarchaeota archaeon]|nr:4Fe-4S binding protein [Candidatus Micrarchaeota archaeon]
MDLVVKPGTRNKTGSWRSFRPVVDLSKCTKCGICETFCPDYAIEVTAEGAKVDYDYCKGCLICVKECPFKAISSQSEK